MKVNFELSPKDIRYFRDRLRHVRNRYGEKDESRVLRRAASLVQKARDAEPPEFVLGCIDKLDQMTLMLVDEEWRLEGRDRARILNALAYFAEPDDLVPDQVPGLGYVDDAIMIELAAQELKHELEAYADFCELRKQKVIASDVPKRESKRLSLQERMRRRRRKDRDAKKGGSGKGGRLRLW
jgi:uncharacterized membrane protein YkvA (DUF1232 family)